MDLLRNWLTQLVHRTESAEFQVSGKWFLLSILLGISAGLAAIIFDHLTTLIASVCLRMAAGFYPGSAIGEFNPFESWIPELIEFNPWILLLVITVGGALSGLIVQYFAPDAAGPGTGAAITAFHHQRGYIRSNIIWVKTVATAITLGTGGSAGREGPIAQIGAAIGVWLGQRLHLTKRDRRILLAAGMGAGVGAIFRAPLAGALFAAEILYRDAEFEAEVIVPAAMSSIISYGIYSMMLPPEIRYTPMFGEQLRFQFFTPLELIPYTIMAVALILAGMTFIASFHRMRTFFDSLKIPFWTRVGCGAFLSGVAALFLYYGFNKDGSVLGVVGTGYGTLQYVLTGEQPVAISILLVVVFGKILTTSLTVGSGGSGGLFGPSMVIGGCTGVAVAQFLQPLFPAGVIHQTQAYGIVGMAGFFAGCANAPISTIIMVSELTGEYKLLIPTMWVSTLCFLLMRRHNLYRQQVPTRLESPAHRGDFIIDVLEGIQVEEVYRKGTLRMIARSTPLEKIVHIVADTQQHSYPVVDENGRLVGIFSSDDVRAYLYNETIWRLANAEDVMTLNPITITPDDNLNTALRHFTSNNLDELPVVSSTDKGRILGILGRKETISCYNRRVVDLKKTYDEEDSVVLPPGRGPSASA